MNGITHLMLRMGVAFWRWIRLENLTEKPEYNSSSLFGAVMMMFGWVDSGVNEEQP